jgi:Family of unknown function (DUF5309)
MTVPTNLYQKGSLKGNREDLIDKIFNTSPTETPLTSAFGRTTATATFHEWQRDALGAANANNAMIDGDDATMTAQVATDRVGNYLQTFSKVYGVSRRANIIKKAGRGLEMKYLRAKNMLELKRDVEAMVVSSNPAVADTTSVAGKSAGLGVQLYANALHNGAGATASWTSGAPTTAVTAGTNRAFTEALFKTACQSIYTSSGAFVEMAVMSPSHKATFSGFTGIAQNRFEVKGKTQGTVVGAADVYISDFGAISIVPHYLMAGANEVFLLNTDYIELATLDGFKTTELAKTGDSDKEFTTFDTCLAVRSSTAQAKIDDLVP